MNFSAVKKHPQMIGFRVCGGVEAFRAALAKRPVRAIAMSVLASGAIPPREAIEWVAAQNEIDAIVFGTSSRKNIRDTVGIVEACDREADAA